ncbi:MAG: o-succinylbenzoate synthase [Liquorilactobacillus ghanensis]|uniref:o-succinylbenzoate synthase n=1 Tax=Liquorilactobacillus ghanensis TaxID=399370 RepID=UPI0039E95C86
MKLSRLALLPVKLQLKQPFATSHGNTSSRPLTLIEAVAENGLHGYGELEAFAEPTYLAETQLTARWIIQTQIIPRLRGKNLWQPQDFSMLTADIQGNQAAKAAVEMAIWDIFAQQHQLSLAEYLGQFISVKPRTEIAVGISLGAQAEFAVQQQIIQQALAAGYQRIKLKLRNATELMQAIKLLQKFPQAKFMLDANSCLSYQQLPQLQKLAALPNLLLVEQPLRTTDLVEHAQLQQKLSLAICLDENILSLDDVKTAVALGSCRAINLKASRVGGFTVALQIIKYCQQQQLKLWCGGMLEGGIGRAASLALASLPVFDYPGDLSASERYYQTDLINERFILKNGQIKLPQQTGLGVSLQAEYIKKFADQPNLLV